MRPDEHKQKKNTQYKKKHGIKTAKNAGEDSKSGDKRRNQPKHRDDKASESRRDTAVRSGAGAGLGQAQTKTSSDSSDSDTGSSQSRGPVYERKSFSRRQIVSNWARYELPEASETSAEQRGEDFTKLLASAGDALAQFRFKDEQDWEESSATVPPTSQIISLDFQSLANAVDCVPLYRRLDVDKDNFTENQVILLDLEAQKKCELYSNSHGQSPVDVDSDLSQSVAIVTQKPDSQDSARRKQQGEISLSTLAKPSSVSLDFGKPQNIKDGKQVGTEMKSSVSKTTSGDSVEDSTVVDEDLDFLLSLDNPSQTDMKKPVLSKDVQDNVESKPDDPNIENTSVSSEVKLSTEAKAGSAAKEEDLEDWLDSVLGD